MEYNITISLLNDFIFCPYSIYLQNSYMTVDKEIFHSEYQQKGKNAHLSIDNQSYSTAKDDITSLAVFSEKWGLYGKIDLLKIKEKTLIERKRQIVKVYLGYKFQLWAQYFCLIEMGYEIDHLFFYSMIDNRKILLNIPSKDEEKEFWEFIMKVRAFQMTDTIKINENKCARCVYLNLCDRTTLQDKNFEFC